MLKSLCKNFSKEKVLRAGRLLRERGIAVTWYLLAGGPGETEETLQETFETIDRAAGKWDLVNIGVGLRVYDGSPIARRLKTADPNCTTDNFLRPVAYVPKDLDIQTLKFFVKRHALRRTNYFMYDEDEKTPLFVMRIGTLIFRLFAPRQPIWRWFIIIRNIQKMLGIAKLKQMIFSYVHKEAGTFGNQTSLLRDKQPEMIPVKVSVGAS